ncbi:MAG: tetratricopeptide repeat protein [Planctomycetota bacterium]|nr:MAG: tetratricopeptide repeat protein [Planctomycetota bacterium]
MTGPAKHNRKGTEIDKSNVPRLLLRRTLVVLFIACLASIGYLNADHKDRLFDTGFNQLELSNPSRAFGLYVQRTLWPFWRPGQSLAQTSFMLNAMVNKVLGLEAFDLTTFLVVNILIHALNACLVYFLVGTMLRQVEADRPKPMWIPLVSALLFAVHPIHASSVAYIIQRRGAMAATFYLLAILSYLGARKGSKKNSCRSWRRIALITAVPICYILSFKCKPMALTLPFTVLAVEFCLRASDRAALKRYLAVLIPGLALSVVGMFVFAWSQGLFDPRTFQISEWGRRLSWGPWVHFLTESRAFVHYWKLLILPLPQWSCINHHFELSRSLFEHYAIVAILFHVLLLLAGFFAALRRYPLAALGVFWFYIALIPYVALPQTELLVEYKTYLPGIGLVLILAEALRILRHRFSLKVQVPLVVVLAAALLTITVRRNVIYQSSYNLWVDAVNKYPDSPRAHCSLGAALYELGEIDEAVRHYQETIRLEPDHCRAYFNLAYTYHHQKEYEKAIEYYKKAVSIKPDFARAHYDYALLLSELARTDEAIEHLKLAVKYDWYNLEAKSILAKTLYEQGSFDKAIVYYRQVLKIDPHDLAALNNLAAALVKVGQIDEGVRQFEKVLELDRNHHKTHYNLAGIMILQGKAKKAIGHLEAAVKIDPDYAAAHYRLADTLMRQGNIDRALLHYKEVLRISPDNQQARKALDAVLGKQSSELKR